METLPHKYPEYTSRFEYRYPYLDKDLVEFLLRIPREQLLEPARRRSLMRRSLVQIVPREILERRRKALLTRGPLHALRHNQQGLKDLLSNSLLAGKGLINREALTNTLESALKGGGNEWRLPLLRAIAFELWLRHINKRPDISLVGI
jgi:asparagine synthase (glutamine-hydrolysing)